MQALVRVEECSHNKVAKSTPNQVSEDGINRKLFKVAVSALLVLSKFHISTEPVERGATAFCQ